MFEKIGLLFDIPNFGINLGDWFGADKGFLFITGLSGSGKTTIAKRAGDLHGVTLVHLDGYLSKQLRKRLGDKAYEANRREAFRTLGMQILKEEYPDGRVVFDGAQAVWLDHQELSKHSVVIIGRSFISSTFSAMARDFTPEHFAEYKSIRPDLHLMYNIRMYGQLRKLMTTLDQIKWGD